MTLCRVGPDRMLTVVFAHEVTCWQICVCLETLMHTPQQSILLALQLRCE